MNEDDIRQAALHVEAAVKLADEIAQAEPVGYSDFGTNPRRRWSDKRAFTLKDARQLGRMLAKELRLAWDLLDPPQPRS